MKLWLREILILLLGIAMILLVISRVVMYNGCAFGCMQFDCGV